VVTAYALAFGSLGRPGNFRGSFLPT
jgi:hypothetical protein